MDGASRWAARCAAVLFRRRSTSPAPGFALRPQPPSVASFRNRLAGARASSVHHRFSVGGPLRCRPLPQALDVAGARFRPSPTASVRGLLPLSFAGYPRVGITLARRRAGAPRRTACSNLGRVPAEASGFRASAGFTLPRLWSMCTRRAALPSHVPVVVLELQRGPPEEVRVLERRHRAPRGGHARGPVRRHCCRHSTTTSLREDRWPMRRAGARAQERRGAKPRKR